MDKGLQFTKVEVNQEDFMNKNPKHYPSIELDDVSYETKRESDEYESINLSEEDVEGDKIFDAYDEFDGEEDQDDQIDPSEVGKEEELEIKIDLEPLLKKIFDDRKKLKESLDLWAAQEKISLNFRTQERINLDGSKVSKLICSKKEKLNCPFFLEFRSDEKTDKYKLTKHCNIHNHSLNKFHTAEAITPNILKKINLMKNSCKTYGELTKIINDEFGLNFHRKTIYYQVIKLREEENGKLSEDATKLIELLKQDSEKRNSFYDIMLKDQEFQGISFMTQRMISVVKHFSDVIIMDTTHGTNRFNLPLLDIAAINNFGKTITCFFGVLPDQKFETFVWALQNFKDQIQLTPKVIFGDEDDALRKGKYLLNFIKSLKQFTKFFQAV